MTLTYNPRLAKVKVDPHAKIKVKGKRFKQECAHRQMDGHTRTHSDATKRIISPATWSIKIKRYVKQVYQLMLMGPTQWSLTPNQPLCCVHS